MDILQPNYFDSQNDLWVDTKSKVSAVGPWFSKRWMGLIFLLTILGSYASLWGLWGVSDLRGNFYLENGIWFVVGVGAIIIIMTLYFLFSKNYYTGVERLIYFLPNDPMDVYEHSDTTSQDLNKLQNNMYRNTQRSLMMKNRWIV